MALALPATADIPDDRALYADVKGKVVDDATGQPAPGVTVSLLYESAVTDKEGEFVFYKIPFIHTAEMSVRVATKDGIIIGCTTFDVPVKFYPLAVADGDRVDVVIVEPGVDTYVTLRLRKVTVDEVDAYCGSCHRNNPCAETSTFKQVVGTKADLRGIIVVETELEKFRAQLSKIGLTKESYLSIRYQDTHPDNLDMNEKVTTVGVLANMFRQTDKLILRTVVKDNVEHRYTVCDTCHARHVPTSQRQFVVMPYEDQSELCYQCHR